MSDDDTRVLVCAPVAGMPEALEGSVVRWCNICGAEVWMSPDGQAFVEATPAVSVQCNPCAYGVLATVDEYRIEGVPGSERMGPVTRPMLQAFRQQVEQRKRQR